MTATHAKLADQIRYTQRAWKYRLRGDRAEVRFVRSHISAGDACIDIGAHKGAYTYWMRRCAGPSGRVTAFEPQPALAEYLRKIAVSRNWGNVHIEQAAVADAPGTLSLVVPGGGTSPGAHLARGGESDTGSGDDCGDGEGDNPGAGPGAGPGAFDVWVCTLDAYFADRQKPIGLIKCDVEGAELEAFRGGEALLSEDRPVLLFECEQRHLGERPIADVFAFLQSLGYDGSFFDRSGALRPVAEFVLAEHQSHQGERFWDRPEYCNNFAFVPS